MSSISAIFPPNVSNAMRLICAELCSSDRTAEFERDEKIKAEAAKHLSSGKSTPHSLIDEFSQMEVKKVKSSSITRTITCKESGMYWSKGDIYNGTAIRDVSGQNWIFEGAGSLTRPGRTEPYFRAIFSNSKVVYITNLVRMDGSKYSGQLLDGKYHGRGVLVTPVIDEYGVVHESQIYNGYFEHGHPSKAPEEPPHEPDSDVNMLGEPVEKHPDVCGSLISGPWPSDTPLVTGGEGRIGTAIGVIFKPGTDDVISYEGTLNYPDKKKYEGSIRNGQPDGIGILSDHTGRVLHEGRFSAGKPVYF